MEVRKNAIKELNKIAISNTLSGDMFEEVMHMGLKNIIKCYYDHS
jgi:hypothetical protein